MKYMENAGEIQYFIACKTLTKAHDRLYFVSVHVALPPGHFTGADVPAGQ
jgi:hypothetical protein